MQCPSLSIEKYGNILKSNPEVFVEIRNKSYKPNFKEVNIVLCINSNVFKNIVLEESYESLEGNFIKFVFI